MKVTISADSNKYTYELTESQLNKVLTCAHDCEMGTWKESQPVQKIRAGGTDARNGENGLYWGPMFIRCKECGHTKAFWKRKAYPISEFICNECGAVTQLVGLKMAYLKCECGRELRYRTNLDAPVITVNCLYCETPVDLKLNYKGSAYVTLNDNSRK